MVTLEDVLFVLEQNSPIDIRVRMAKILLKEMIETRDTTKEKQMTLPTKITVGKTTYSVRRGAPSGCLGNVDYDKKVISVAMRDGLGNELEPEEVRDTFWHEMTHAILHDMSHPLRDDEKFVIKFANRLSCAIDSAKF